MIPNNVDLERTVLGCLIINKADYVFRLTEDDFFNQTSLLVYKAVRYMAEKKAEIDIITVSDILKKRIENSLEVINSLVSQVPTTENIEHYIQNLQEYTLRRKIIKTADEAKEKALTAEFDGAHELKSTILQMFDIPVNTKQKTDNSIGGIMTEVYNNIDIRYNNKNEEKLFTGFYDLDKITAGLHPDEFTIIAARPGVGKTAYALQLMINLSHKQNQCLFISREMSKNQIGERILSNLSGVDGQKLRFCKTLLDEDWKKIASSMAGIDRLPAEINDSLASVQEIRAYCRELKTKDKLDVLFVDYLQLCRSLKKCESRRLEVDDISRQLKEMSLEFHIPVIALSQLSREAVGSNDPELHHLKESGGLEQDADNVTFLHIPQGTDETADTFDIKVIMSKQRNGPAGSIYLGYCKKNFRFWNKSRGR